MSTDVNFDLLALNHFQCDLDGLDAEQASRTLWQFFCRLADEIGWDSPDWCAPGEMQLPPDGYTTLWDGPWLWAPALVASSGIVGRGFLPIRCDLFFTPLSVQRSPRVQLWAPDSAIPRFVVEPWGDRGLAFNPRIFAKERIRQ